MRKSLILMFLLFLLSLGLLWGAYGMINPLEDAVSIEETVLSGDRTAAKGIAVANRTASTDHLLWDTVYTIGEDLNVATEFTFYPQGYSEDYQPEHWMMLYTNLNYGISGNGINLEEENVRSHMAVAPALDVAGRTPAGQTREETVSLQDYYPCYPLSMETSVPDVNLEMNEEIQQEIADYFSIPVPKKHRVQISVTKDSGGNLTDVECQSVSGETMLDTVSAITDSGCYLVMTANDGDTGEPISLPSGISGIHFLPFEKHEGFTRPKAQDMKLVFPLDSETTQAIRLMQSADGRRLLLFTREAGSIQLTVIEVETMRQLQKMELAGEAAKLDLWQTEQSENFLVVIYSDGSFSVLTDEDDGSCAIRLTGNFYECEEIRDVPFWNMALDYDGSRLAAVVYQERYGFCSTYLMVYDENGLAYAGKYDQSSDRSPDVGADNYSAYGVRPLNTNSLRVTCG